MTMDLELAGQAIAEVTADFTVSLQIDAGYEVRIEAAFHIQTPNGAANEYVPGEPGVDRHVEALKGERITRATVDDSGILRLVFESGLAVQVTPDDSYEAWTVAGPSGMKIVCMPGGELASWSPETS